MLPKGAACLLLLALIVVVTSTTSSALESNSRFLHIKRDNNNFNPNRRSGIATRHESGPSSFDPDVLNRFLEDYASKIKRTTERPMTTGGFVDKESEANKSTERNSTETHSLRDELTQQNDTAKRDKHYSGNSGDERKIGWVELEAIPWSKSKISKWQANPASQRPWPDSKPWDKPSYSSSNNKPWNNDFPSRPASTYESNKPWQNQLTKPQHWADNSLSASKPWQSERPQSDRPGYASIEKYEDPNHAQKWPPEKPSWNDRYESIRPSDIITDDGPPNFPNNPNNWDRPGQRPSYTHHTESYVNEPGGWHDRNDYHGSNKFHRPEEDNYYDNRPHFSQYQYPTRSEFPHSPKHPANGDGQWVLVSTNRGYSKTRQRSIKFDTVNPMPDSGKKKHEPEEHVPAVTSKRQIRLTVLPSINGTNTTTSHGGLLEVERTFKTVDQSQKEYEMKKTSTKSAYDASNRPGIPASIVLNNRPFRNVAPSSSAVLAAVGAGMLPATMAMMLPMMLGKRRKRDVAEGEDGVLFVRVPKQVFAKGVRKRM